MSGWFSVQRDIFKHDFFKREPFTEREAWIWIIAKAVYKESKHTFSGEVHPVPRGSFYTTLSDLEEDWRWSSTRIRKYLKKLVAEGMIKHESYTRKTFISVCNYDDYQNDPNKKTQSGNVENTKEDTKRVQLNNNIINTTTTPDSDFSNSSSFSDPIVQRMFEALGSPPELKREMNTPHSWLELECDLEADILPTLRMMAQRQKSDPSKKIRAWSYCSDAVFEAMEKRKNPPVNVRPIRGHQVSANGMSSMFASMSDHAKDKGL